MQRIEKCIACQFQSYEEKKNVIKLQNKKYEERKRVLKVSIVIRKVLINTRRHTIVSAGLNSMLTSRMFSR